MTFSGTDVLSFFLFSSTFAIFTFHHEENIISFCFLPFLDSNRNVSIEHRASNCWWWSQPFPFVTNCELLLLIYNTNVIYHKHTHTDKWVNRECYHLTCTSHFHYLHMKKKLKAVLTQLTSINIWTIYHRCQIWLPFEP